MTFQDAHWDFIRGRVSRLEFCIAFEAAPKPGRFRRGSKLREDLLELAARLSGADPPAIDYLRPLQQSDIASQDDPAL